MSRLNRRQFLAAAAAVGAWPAWAGQSAAWPTTVRRERRDLFPEGVASGDPDDTSVLLWTRRPVSDDTKTRLLVEIARDPAFGRLVATTMVAVTASADWTCRVLVGDLEPGHVYWYRFVDQMGNVSRTGRTMTAPADDDGRPLKFAFVSCQNINLGALSAYRRMIAEDERAPESDQLGFVLHLGDYIYEAVWYPEDNPAGVAGRRVSDVVRYSHGERIDQGALGIVHIPTNIDDYRAVYRAYRHDPDLQDARARWPFMCIWDNHEFSWAGWQSFQIFNGRSRPAQTRKVAANQAWFEYQPTRAVQGGRGSWSDTFQPPAVRDTPVERFDADGFGDESNNRAAVTSLRAYRALRYGRHVELIVTDQRSHRSEIPWSAPESAAFASADFPYLFPQEAHEILDAGRAYAGGRPPSAIRFGGRDIANFRRGSPPQTLLGGEQKKWFLERLAQSQATWKIWASSQGTLDHRVDPQNLPSTFTTRWPGSSYAGIAGDPSVAYHERAEIYTAARAHAVTGFVTVCGDRHSFWAGLAAPSLPPRPFEPVGVAFVTGSISTFGLAEMIEHDLPADHPLRPLYLRNHPPASNAEPVVNVLMRHGVRAALEYSRSGDIERARSQSNRALAPHLRFLDHGGHGYATVRVASDALECEFVCIPRPIEREALSEGPPVLYRVTHRTPLWKPGEAPRLEQRVVEGNPALSI